MVYTPLIPLPTTGGLPAQGAPKKQIIPPVAPATVFSGATPTRVLPSPDEASPPVVPDDDAAMEEAADVEKKASKSPVKKKKALRKKAIRDPNKPKRNLSSYMFFTQAARAQVKQEHPEFKLTEVAKELGMRWRAMPEDQKKPFEDQARLDKERYISAMKEYVPPAGASEEDAEKSPGTKGKKKKAIRDPNEPKRNLSSYMFFTQATRAQVKQEHPEFKLTEVAKELGIRWRAMPEDQKKPFEDKARLDKERYISAMKTFSAKASEDSEKSPAAESSTLLGDTAHSNFTS